MSQAFGERLALVSAIRSAGLAHGLIASCGTAHPAAFGIAAQRFHGSQGRDGRAFVPISRCRLHLQNAVENGGDHCGLRRVLRPHADRLDRADRRISL